MYRRNYRILMNIIKSTMIFLSSISIMFLIEELVYNDGYIIISGISGLFVLIAFLAYIYIDTNIYPSPDPAYKKRDIQRIEKSMSEISKKHSNGKR